jgi:glycosyltransferase involved in cell wall biosynthesis
MSISFSVITPCLNANKWIRCCVASVADQQGVSVQHIVQDGLSTDGTAEYLCAEPKVETEIKKDRGMYDAINHGWSKCTGEFVLHLNADEELLPGALAAVGEYFQKHPDVDVVIAGTIICDPEGALLCYRKPLRPPLSILLTSHHPIQSCAIFLRRASFKDRKHLYDPDFRIISDALLMIDILRARKRIGLLNQFTSVFFLTGENLGLLGSPRERNEHQHQLLLAPRWMTAAKSALRLGFHLRKFLTGQYVQGALKYAIYTPSSGTARRQFVVAKPSGIYRPYQGGHAVK